MGFLSLLTLVHNSIMCGCFKAPESPPFWLNQAHLCWIYLPPPYGYFNMNRFGVYDVYAFDRLERTFLLIKYSFRFYLWKEVDSLV